MGSDRVQFIKTSRNEPYSFKIRMVFTHLILMFLIHIWVGFFWWQQLIVGTNLIICVTTGKYSCKTLDVRCASAEDEHEPKCFIRSVIYKVRVFIICFCDKDTCLDKGLAKLCLGKS